MTKKFEDQEIDLAMNELVGQCEKILIRNGHDLGSGAVASKLTHELFFEIVARAVIGRNAGEELY